MLTAKKFDFSKLRGAVEFNAAAADAAVSDNWPMLCALAADLAERQRTSLRKAGRAPLGRILQDDLQSVGTGAAVDRAQKWLAEGGDFYKLIGTAARDAMRDHLRAGGYREDNAWRGGYDTHARRFSSQDPTAANPADDDHVPEGEPEAASSAWAASDVVKVEATNKAAAEGSAAHDGDTADTEHTRDPGKATPDDTATPSKEGRARNDGKTRFERARIKALERIDTAHRDRIQRIDRAGSLKRYLQQYRQEAQRAEVVKALRAALYAWRRETAKVLAEDTDRVDWHGCNTVTPEHLLWRTRRRA